MAIAEFRSFNPSGYEILDDQIELGRVAIWSVHKVTPRLGDVLLVERDGRAYDVTIETLSPVKGGGWTATGQASPL